MNFGPGAANRLQLQLAPPRRPSPLVQGRGGRDSPADATGPNTSAESHARVCRPTRSGRHWRHLRHCPWLEPKVFKGQPRVQKERPPLPRGVWGGGDSGDLSATSQSTWCCTRGSPVGWGNPLSCPSEGARSRSRPSPTGWTTGGGTSGRGQNRVLACSNRLALWARSRALGLHPQVGPFRAVRKIPSG